MEVHHPRASQLSKEQNHQQRQQQQPREVEVQPSHCQAGLFSAVLLPCNTWSSHSTVSAAAHTQHSQPCTGSCQQHAQHLSMCKCSCSLECNQISTWKPGHETRAALCRKAVFKAGWLLPLVLLLPLSVPAAAAASFPAASSTMSAQPPPDFWQGGRSLQQSANKGSSVQQQGAYGPRDLAQCMLQGQTTHNRVPITWKRAMKDEAGTLHVQAMWWSRKTSNLPVTVVTQLSASRLTQLSAQCRSWEGPLSAAVYVPLLEEPQPDEDAVEQQQPQQPVGAHQVNKRSLAGVADIRSSDGMIAGDTDSTQQPGRKLTRHSAKFAAHTMTVIRHQISLLRAELDMALERELGHDATRVLGSTTPAASLTYDMDAARMLDSGGVPTLTSVVVPASEGARKKTLNIKQLRPKLSVQNQEVLRLAQQAVHTLHASAERLPWACHLNIVLVFEVVADAKSASLLYPVNQLRNLARLQAQTDLIAQLDVDMLPSNQFAAWLNTGENAASMVKACSQNTVYIMPAFEVHGNNVSHSAALADEYVTRPKKDLEAAVTTGLITHFDALRFPIGHNTTNFPRWFRSTEPYPIVYSYRFEPWLVVHRQLAPWHDVRFRGYGNNKIQQVCHLNATGNTFMVHPTAFIVHRAHAVTDARKQLMVDLRRHQKENRKRPGHTNNDSLYGHTKLLFDKAKDAMDRGAYTTVLDPVTRECIHALPWYNNKPPAAR